MKGALELRSLHCNVNRTEAGSESRLGMETGSLRKISSYGSISQRDGVQEDNMERSENAKIKSKMACRGD